MHDGRVASAPVHARPFADRSHRPPTAAEAAEEPHAVVVERTYIVSTFVLQTRWKSSTGEALITEFMPVGDRRASLVRRVEGLSGEMKIRQELIMRFHYGDVVPWVNRVKDEQTGQESIVAIAGPDALVLHGDDLPRAAERRHRGEFTVRAGEKVDYELCWFPSHQTVPPMIDVDAALEETVNSWQSWCSRFPPQGRLPRHGQAFAAGAACHDARDHRRNRCRADHLAAGVLRRGAELGLPVLSGSAMRR